MTWPFENDTNAIVKRLSKQAAAKTVNPYFCYSFPWLAVLIYLAILLIVQFLLISYTTGARNKRFYRESL